MLLSPTADPTLIALVRSVPLMDPRAEPNGSLEDDGWWKTWAKLHLVAYQAIHGDFELFAGAEIL